MQQEWKKPTPNFETFSTRQRLNLLDQLASSADAESIPFLLHLSKQDPSEAVRIKAADVCRRIAEGLEHPRDPYGQFRI